MSAVLAREAAPCCYIYRQRLGTHEQLGVAAVCHIDDYDANLIKRHEKTRRDKEDDRTRLIGTLGANTGPVFLTYRGTTDVNRQVAATASTNAPLYDFVAPDGVQHTVWRVNAAGALTEAFSRVPAAYVADGHHRTASAVRVGRERRAANPHHTGDEDYNWFLAVLFPAEQLKVLSYNRAVQDLNGFTEQAFLERVQGAFEVQAAASPDPTRAGDIRMYLRGGWYALAWRPQDSAAPIDRLDVTGLQDRLLAPVLGIDDPRTSQRIQFVGGIRGTDALVALVDGGEAAVAFSMYPTSVEQMMEIADAGEFMPPKSTWFEPKLRSGLFIHTF